MAFSVMVNFIYHIADKLCWVQTFVAFVGGLFTSKIRTHF